MAGDQSLWRLLLVCAVYLIDLLVLVRLCRDEFREWRRGERQAEPIAARADRSASTVMAG
jgi:hypothetical protein